MSSSSLGKSESATKTTRTPPPGTLIARDRIFCREGQQQEGMKFDDDCVYDARATGEVSTEPASVSRERVN